MDSNQADVNRIIKSEDRIALPIPPLPHRIGVVPSRKKTQRQQKKHYAQPTSGCLSELSIPIPREHDYFDAVKAFTETYSDYQAYLAQLPLRNPSENATGIGIDDYAPHDSLALDSDVNSGAISDDEIERCGYLGWLRH